MKYCTKCGNQLFDEAIICPKCGTPIEEIANNAVDAPQNFKAPLIGGATAKRKLTITRRKSFIGSLSTMAVYVEDPSSGIRMSDTPCREIGVLPNGGEQTFMIDEKEAKVFVAPKLGGKKCNDFYRIPAGNDDVFLSGENKLDFVTNTFRFDNLTDEEALENRRKGKRRGIGIFAISFGLFLLFYILNRLL